MREWQPALVGAMMLGLAVLAVQAGAGQEGRAPGVLKTGLWGGEQVRLEVRAGEPATLDLPCAHGRIPGPLAVAADGRVDWPGRFVQERGGPVRGDSARGGAVRERDEDATPPGSDQEGVPARFKGTLTGDVLTLEVVVADRRVGSLLTLTHGRRVRLVKCQ